MKTRCDVTRPPRHRSTEQRMELQEACTRFVRWVSTRLIESARGDRLNQLPVDPAGRLWLGRLAPEQAVMQLGLGDRGERLDPCAVGIRFRPRSELPLHLHFTVSLRVWSKQRPVWVKSRALAVHVSGIFN